MSEYISTSTCADIEEIWKKDDTFVPSHSPDSSYIYNCRLHTSFCTFFFSIRIYECRPRHKYIHIKTKWYSECRHAKYYLFASFIPIHSAYTHTKWQISVLVEWHTVDGEYDRCLGNDARCIEEESEEVHTQIGWPSNTPFFIRVHSPFAIYTYNITECITLNSRAHHRKTAERKRVREKQQQ